MKSPCCSSYKSVLRMAVAFGILVILLAIPTALFAQASPQPRDSGPRIVPRDEQYADMTYPEWAAKWWQWAALLPSTHHPLFDTTDCSAGQIGPVWFFDGRFLPPWQGVKRTCMIPAGKALFVGIVVAEFSFIEAPVGATEADLRAANKSYVDLVTNLSVSIDGRAVRNPEKYRICKSGPTCTPLESPLFTYTLAPTDNPWAAAGSYLHGDPSLGLMPDGLTSEGVTDAYFLLVEPLSPGWHTIFFSAEVPVYGVKFDDTYQIQVLK